MKIFLTDQQANFGKHLTELKSEQVIQYDKLKLTEKTSEIALVSAKTLDQVELDFFFHYKIFPPHNMTFLTQWEQEDRTMGIGDTIVQQVFVPPIRSFSQKIVFGVRINDVIHEVNRKGFSYQTLQGHVEKGESTFTIEQTGSGLIFKIKTFSEPGNLLTMMMLGPIFSVPYQAYCTKAALNYVKMQV